MTITLIVTNAKVITMAPDRAIVQAFAVGDDGRLVAAGTNDQIERLAGASTERIDADGRTITPGLVDSHIHVLSLGSTGAGAALAFVGSESAIDISKATTVAEVVRIIADAVRQRSTGDWILTSWPSSLAPGESITCDTLDEVALHNPVMVTGYPNVVVNSFLMRQAGITDQTQAPPGGEIGHDPKTGKPNGIFAFRAIYQLLPQPPEPSVEMSEDAIRNVQTTLLSEGLTTYKDAGLRGNAIRAYRNLHARGELRCRTHMMQAWIWSEKEALELAENLKPGGDDWLRMGAVKLSMDGSIPSGTAWSYEPWDLDKKPADGRGYAKMLPEELDAIVRTLHAAGLQVSCHCGGDRAIDTYLSAIEKAASASDRSDCRHTIIHCELPTDAAIARMVKLGDNIAVETQSTWMLGGEWAQACGPERAKRFMPLRSLIDNGIVVGNGSDFPSGHFPPRLGLSTACTRRPVSDVFAAYPYGREEALSVEEALYTYTMGSAKCLFWEDNIGSLEPGKYADFVVWEEDLLTIHPEEIKDANVLMTAVNGKILYRRSVSDA